MQRGHHPSNCSHTPRDGGPGALTPRSISGRPSITRLLPRKRCCMNSKPPERLWLDRWAPPVGEALIVTDEAGFLRAFDWADCESSMARLLRLHYGAVVPEPRVAPGSVRRLLRNYFEGDLGCLGAIQWRTAGTPFQRAVWTALTMIAPGETLSYGALAAKLGCP